MGRISMRYWESLVRAIWELMSCTSTCIRRFRHLTVAVDRDHRLYAVDAGFQNVQIFDEEGSLLLFFASPGSGVGEGQARRPGRGRSIANPGRPVKASLRVLAASWNTTARAFHELDSQG